jgi:hypothetical protein
MYTVDIAQLMFVIYESMSHFKSSDVWGALSVKIEHRDICTPPPLGAISIAIQARRRRIKLKNKSKDYIIICLFNIAVIIQQTCSKFDKENL